MPRGVPTGAPRGIFVSVPQRNLALCPPLVRLGKRTGPLKTGRKPMARKKVATRKIGRNAETGRFTSVEVARKHPKTHIVETLRSHRC